MRILQVHNSYQQGGGEDVVVANERALLTDHGHETRLWSVSNDAIDGTWAKVRTAWQAPYSPAARERMGEAIRDFTPGVVHVHNFFPLLTPSIYDACRDADIPLVQTLHNYRTICAAAILMRDGRVCEDCIDGSPYQAVLHRCYRGSRLGSFAVARMIDVHRKRRTWQTKVDRFIALTEFGKAKFVEAGFPESRIAVKPNFVEDRRIHGVDGGISGGALFVGRLSPEKGVATFLRAWGSLEVPLRVVGDGPSLASVQAAAAPTVTCLGRQPAEVVAAEMARAAFLIFPSVWYETFGLTIVEAFCQGLPVIVSRMGGMVEIVEDGVTGLHFTPGNSEDLAAKVRWAEAHPEEMRRMGANARRAYEEKYTPEVNYRQLMAIYEQATDSRRRMPVHGESPQDVEEPASRIEAAVSHP